MGVMDDSAPPEPREVVIYIESSVCMKVEELAKGETSASQFEKPKNEKSLLPQNAKKPPKPPRPPRGLSLDSADEKLIKEISEFVKMKRASRVKALRKAKAAKASQAPASSAGNWIAMILTVLFCVLVIFQGNFWGFLEHCSHRHLWFRKARGSKRRLDCSFPCQRKKGNKHQLESASSAASMLI